ncbi:acylphosphatase [candidate division KSB1 bacterium]|nr:MAG: acylphosphatase [candidate division KSB1 bacterium]
MDVCAKMWVHGMVQGVGFRYFVYRVAQKLGLVGYVRNLPDGRVEIEVEGKRGLIEELIKEIKVGNRWADVRDIKIDWQPYQGKYTRFDITF